MNFNFRDSHSSSLFKFNHILKLEDKILIFKSWFIFCSDVHNYQTVSSTADNILNHLIELILMVKNQSLQQPLIVRMKLNISSVICILFPETCAITGTHASKFTCAIYCTREIMVFSHKETFFIEGFSIEHNQL